MAKQAVAPSSPAERYLQRIGERSRESIEKMSDIIWSVNPEHDNLQQMLLRMKTYVNEIFEAKDTAVHWQVPEAVEYVKLDMTQRKNFYLVFKEVVTNAAKYSHAKNIFICLSVGGKTVSLHVKDDGAGFDKQQVRQGNGLKNIQQRAALLKGRVSVETCINRGTAIAFQFPFAS
jgi:signal transduction histidine kinase